MRAVRLVRDGLADVMKQGRPRRYAGVTAQLRSQHRRQSRALDRVMQHVLAVARAEAELPQQLDELRVERSDVRLEHRLLADVDHVLVYLRLGLVKRLLDPGRVDAA